MDSLRASYKDEDDPTGSGPPQNEALPATIDRSLSETPSDADRNPKPESSVGIEGKESATVLEDRSSDEASVENNGNGKENQSTPNNASNSPNFARVSDTEGEEDEEEPPSKKQRQLSSLTSTSPEDPQNSDDIGGIGSVPPHSTPAAASEEAPTPSIPAVTAAKSSSKSSKKSKKKNNNVWTRPTSRKGKKKAKPNGNNNRTPATNAGESDDKVLITPTPKFPDKSDDNPDAKICLSKVNKAEKVELSEDRMSAGSTKGYRMVRATRGVVEGAWYFEIKIVHLGETGHTRLGWSTENGDLQAPVGYDGNSFGYRDVDGSKVHKAVRDKYGEEGYKEGDVIGFYINLPEGSLYTPKPPRWVWHKGQKYVSAPDAKDDPPKVVPGSEISFFKKGVCQGVAFSDLYGGRYFPAASMYTLPNQPNCTVKFNFGPHFEFFPDDFGGRPVPRPMIEVPYHGLDVRVENGSSWYPTRMCPMLSVIKDQVTKFVEAGEK